MPARELEVMCSTSGMPRIFEISVGYMVSQLSGKREDRLLELAFHHESVRFPALRELVLSEWQAQHEYVASVHRIMGDDQKNLAV